MHLVVENDDEVRSFVVRAVSSLGYDVLDAADGELAMTVPAQDDKKVELLLSDVVLPGRLRGPELTERARAVRPGLAVALMSGYPEGSMAHATPVPSSVVYLSKPFRRDELAAQLREALRRARNEATLQDAGQIGSV